MSTKRDPLLYVEGTEDAYARLGVAEPDEEVLAQALYDGHVQHVIHAYSYTNREIAREIITAYRAVLRPSDERVPESEER